MTRGIDPMTGLWRDLLAETDDDNHKDRNDKIMENEIHDAPTGSDRDVDYDADEGKRTGRQRRAGITLICPQTRLSAEANLPPQMSHGRRQRRHLQSISVPLPVLVALRQTKSKTPTLETGSRSGIGQTRASALVGKRVFASAQPRPIAMRVSRKPWRTGR